MFDGLGEHILIELGSYMTKVNEDFMTEEDVEALKSIIKQIVFAVTKTTNFTPDENGNLTLKYMLSKFTGGTDKMKRLPQPPTDRMSIKALRLLDRRSSIMKAQHRINGLNSGTDNNERSDEANPILNYDSIDPLTKNDYSLIVNCCWDLCRLMKNRSSDSHLHDIIGYKILASRTVSAKPFGDIMRLEVPSSVTRKIMLLINSANGDTNNRKRPPATQTIETLPPITETTTTSNDNDNGVNNNDSITPNILSPLRTTLFNTEANEQLTDNPRIDEDKDDATESVSSTISQIDDNTTIKEDTTTISNEVLQANVIPSKRMFCCSCMATNRMDPSLPFLKIPRTTIKITDKTTDYRRLCYYTEQMRRKLYCQRLGVPITNRDRQYLTFCSLHQLQSECIDIAYRKQDGTREIKTMR
jgi:hypothetical protein